MCFLPEKRNLWISEKLNALLTSNGIQNFCKVRDYEMQWDGYHLILLQLFNILNIFSYN